MSDPEHPTAPPDDPSLIDLADLALALGTDLEHGLGAEEVAKRLQADGPNELRAVPPMPAWRRALAQLQDPLVYLLGAAAAVALAAWWNEGRGRSGVAGWPLDAMVIASVVVLSAVLGWVQEAKAAQAVAALAKMATATSAVLRDGAVARVPSAELVKGDVLVLSEGDAVGADARLAQAAALMLLEAPLTGESEAVLKDAAQLSATAALGDRLNMVFKGTAVAQGSGRAIVTATGMQTEMGSIATLLDSTPDAPTPLQIEIAHLGKVLGIAALAIAGVVVATILLISDIQDVGDVVTVLQPGVSLAVAAVPEGLLAILSVVLAIGVRRMARHRAIVKKLTSVETLGAASVIASGKTGTLTRGEMTVQRVFAAPGRCDITGVGYTPEGRAEQAGAPLPEGALRSELQAVLLGGSLAGNAHLQRDETGTWVIQGDPTEAAFLVAGHKLGRKRIGEIPFTSQRKMMSVLTLLTLDLFLPGGLIEPVDRWLGTGPHSMELARTAGFTVLVLTQLFNCFNTRSASASAFRAAFSNRWLWAAVALSAALQVAVVHLPFLNLAFGTVPLSAGQWGACVAMASGILWFSEGRKLLRRRWNRRAQTSPGPDRAKA